MKLIQSNTASRTFWDFCRGQSAFFRRRGIDFYALGSPDDLFFEFGKTEEVPLYPVAMTKSISPIEDIKGLFQVYRIIKEVNPDIIHGSTPKAGLLTMVGGFLTGCRGRIFFLRGLRSMSLSGWKRRVVFFTEWLTCACSHQVLATSPSLREYAVQSGVCPSHKIKVLHNGTGNGIDSERFDPSLFDNDSRSVTRGELGLGDGCRVLLYVGRMVKDKGIIELSESWKSLRSLYPDLHLVIAGGTKPEEPIPYRIIEDFQSDERVHLAGHVADVAPLYSVADILVHPSHREGIPIAPLEASAMELPVVATRIAGCVDAVLDGETGVLTPPFDPGALTEAVSRLLDDPALAQRLGKAGRERVVRDFRPEDIWEAMYQEYMRVLELTSKKPKENSNGNGRGYF